MGVAIALGGLLGAVTMWFGWEMGVIWVILQIFYEILSNLGWKSYENCWAAAEFRWVYSPWCCVAV